LSHSKERQEKVCLNCNAELHGRYCHQCGQQNTEPKESVWGLITHFFYDITHFDGSFFSTTKYLVTKPGFLSAEYIKGRRARYLNPIRMYVFTSAFFFIIFFSVYDTPDTVPSKDEKAKTGSLFNVDGAREQALKYADTKEDSLDILEDFGYVLDSAGRFVKADSVSVKRKGGARMNLGSSKDYRNLAHYDSVQKALPTGKRDGWFVRMMQRRQLQLIEKYGNDETVIFKQWIKVFVHQFPKMLFVSLPLFALMLRLLYIRRKQFYYVDHGIFTIHLYIFMFVLMLVVMGVGALWNYTNWGIFGWIQGLLWLYSLYYMYKAMRNFYKQSRGKTILKFILANILMLLVMIILFVLFFFVTVFQM
jgi:hypothetical protein